MADRFDRAYTLNFAPVVTIRGPLTESELRRALRCLERRHPLLRARIDRGGPALRFVMEEAAEIPLIVRDVPSEHVLEQAALSIEHCAWPDAGPRAELYWLRHAPSHSTLLLRMHHVTSDGSSGILAMRDLLGFVAEGEPTRVEPLPSPGQEAFFPRGHAATRARFLEAAAKGVAQSKSEVVPFRLARMTEGSLEARRAHVRRLRLDADASARLIQAARRDGATVHGVLMGAVSLAIAQEHGAPGLHRLSHPVDLRRYLRELDPSSTPIGDAVGYYVSAVTTDHWVGGSERLGEVARAVTAAVRAAKQYGEPLLTAPIRGPLLIERTRELDDASFAALCEQKIFVNTNGISNLGPLEHLGVQKQIGALEVEDLFFVAASSVMNQLGGTAVSFDGRISLQMSCVEPSIQVDVLERLVRRVEELLRDYAQAET